MHSDIEILVQAQALEQEIAARREDLERLRPKALAVQKRMKEQTDLLAREQSELTELRKNLDLLNLEIARKESIIKRFEEQQAQIRTTKEMAALTLELDKARQEMKALSEQAAAMQARREQIERDLAALEGNTEDIRKRCEEEIAAIKSEAEELKTQIRALKERHAATLARVPEDLREEYLDLALKYPGHAVVNVQKGNCLGCNMELVPQAKIELRLSRDIVRCHRCGRLLARDLDSTPPDAESRQKS